MATRAGVWTGVHAPLVLVAVLGALGLTLWAVCARGPGARRLAAALILLALARGLAVGADERTRDWPAGRGEIAAVERFAIEAAGWPGARCSVVARPRASPQRAWLDLPPEICPIAAGAEVIVPLDALRFVHGPVWPGAADPLAFARGRGASWALSADRAWRSRADDDGYWSVVARARQAWWAESRGDDARALVVSSLFGVRAALSPTRRRELAIAGLGHLVAVSGMQVTLIAWLVWRGALRVTAWFTDSPAPAALTGLLPVVAYVGLVGAEAPAVRSAVMVVALGLAAWAARPLHGVTVLAWTSAVMLAWRPAWAFDVGFQLSFFAMAALLRAPERAGLALQSWRVSWAIAPVVALHFGETGAWSVATNVVAVPVFSLVLTPAGVLAAVLDPWLGAAAWVPARWAAALVLDIASVGAALPRVPPAALAATAALVLVGHAWRRLACRPAWRRWAPTTLVAVLVIAAWAWRRDAIEPGSVPAIRDARWFAFGPLRAPALVVRGADEGHACVVDPTGDPAQWPPMLEALGVAVIDDVVTRRPPRPGTLDDAPHVVALHRELAATGYDAPVAENGGCEGPSVQMASAAIAVCRRRHDGPSFAAFDGTLVHCFAGERWLDGVGLQ